MTKLEIAIIGKDYHDNYFTKYRKEVIETYKYKGVVKTRKYTELTEEGQAIRDGEALNTEIFTCPCCGRKVTFHELEYWGEDIEALMNDKVTCSDCYEDEMGEDL